MAKVRVYQVAKLAGVDSRTVLAVLQQHGEFVRSASSTLNAPVVRRLCKHFGIAEPERVHDRPSAPAHPDPPPVRSVIQPRHLGNLAETTPQAGTQQEPAAPGSSRSWDEVRLDLLLALKNTSMDVLRLRILSGEEHDRHVVRGRFDIVEESRPEIWLSMKLDDPDALARTAALRSALTLTSGGLPLRRVSHPGDLQPPVVIWRWADPIEAADAALSLWRDGIPAQPGAVRLDLEECAPAEAMRRANVSKRIGQARGPRKPSDMTCIKCGQPLTDPVSRTYRMGPDCRASVGIEFARAMKNSSVDARLWFGSKSPKRWMVALKAELF